MNRHSQHGGVIAAVLITVMVVAVFVVGALVFTGYHVARNVRVEKSEGEGGESVKIETPLGALRVRKTEGTKGLNIPIYPGATESSVEGEGANVEVEFGQDHKQLNIVAAKYVTSDPAADVLEYYRKELPHWIFSRKRRGNFQMEYTEGGYKRIIAIHERHGKTEIGVAAVGEPPAN